MEKPITFYLIGFDGNNMRGAGNAGTFISHTAHEVTLRKQAERFQAMYNHATVYALPACRYTQEVCEMSAEDFYQYVRKNGFCMIRRVSQ